MCVLLAPMQYLRVKSVNTDLFVDLPELTSIRFGDGAFQFGSDNESSELIMRSGYDEMN